MISKVFPGSGLALALAVAMPLALVGSGALAMDMAPAASAEPMAVSGAADMVHVGDLVIAGGFARATLPSAPAGGGFLTITNNGSVDDKLVAAQSPAAGKVTLHSMVMEGNVMKMREVEGGIPIPAGQTVTLKPGGLHLMFEQLKGGLKQGTSVPVTLTFEKAGSVEIQLQVLGIAASAPAEGMAPMAPAN